ncbi:MAG: hypothetical protein CMQ19_01920 [Gammaproteobacteria bacterium]|nr:hypothetical protein [Gammaproteobacteria bacterium]|tara:strand:- start:56 stop:835 length:780 start_codon:yes stop_codon:yes gene_type:complete
MSASNQNDRFLPFAECMNFRHMGGYPAAEGRRTRADRLYRSCIFELNEPADFERFEALSITNIFDFRMPEEREKRPLNPDVAQRPDIHELQISSGNMGSYLTGLKGRKPEPGDIKTRMTQWYNEMPDEGISAYQTMFRHLEDSDGGGLVICNTGKDRTGMAAGLILAALGVPDEIINDDFMLSAWAYRDVEMAMKRYLGTHPLGVDTGYMSEVFTVYPEYIDAFRARVAEMAGTYDLFFEQYLGLTDESRQKLRQKYTE